MKMSDDFVLEVLPNNEVWRLTNDCDVYEIGMKLCFLMESEACAIDGNKSPDHNEAKALRDASATLRRFVGELCDVIEMHYGSCYNG